MLVNTLDSVSPIDGRYAATTKPLRRIFGEGGLIARRSLIELDWLETLCREVLHRQLSDEERSFLKKLRKEVWKIRWQSKVVRLEKGDKKKGLIGLNHDVKSVEVAIAEAFKGTTLESLIPWIHFALTSEDDNNVAYSMQLRDGLEILMKFFDEILGNLNAWANQYAADPMLNVTHYQPATPGTFGKEMRVFWERLKEWVDTLKGAV